MNKSSMLLGAILIGLVAGGCADFGYGPGHVGQYSGYDSYQGYYSGYAYPNSYYSYPGGYYRRGYPYGRGAYPYQWNRRHHDEIRDREINRAAGEARIRQYQAVEEQKINEQRQRAEWQLQQKQAESEFRRQQAERQVQQQQAEWQLRQQVQQQQAEWQMRRQQAELQARQQRAQAMQDARTNLLNNLGNLPPEQRQWLMRHR